VFRLIVVLFCVMCLIVVPLPPGENPFAVKIYIYNFVINRLTGNVGTDRDLTIDNFFLIRAVGL
jgi:hypothetical protein